MKQSDKKQLKKRLKEVERFFTSPKTKKVVKKHLIFWDKAFNGLGNSITNNLIPSQEEKPLLITINKYYLRLK